MRCSEVFVEEVGTLKDIKASIVVKPDVPSICLERANPISSQLFLNLVSSAARLVLWFVQPKGSVANLNFLHV